MPGWEEVGLKEKLEEAAGYPVVVDNDAVASAVGERWIGVARGVQDFVFVYEGWGLSAGIFVEGQVYRGKTGTAGEIGHIPLDPNGPACECGNRGCLVRYCSPREVSASVRRRLKAGEESSLGAVFEKDPESVDYEMVRRAAASGDALALEEVERAARRLGGALKAV
jgi:predicted NBD/HSP70 family sugar kinase